MVGRGSERGNVAPRVRYEGGCLPPQQDTIPYAVKKSQSCAPEDGQKFAPKHVELILEVNKLLLLHLVGFLY